MRHSNLCHPNATVATSSSLMTEPSARKASNAALVMRASANCSTRSASRTSSLVRLSPIRPNVEQGFAGLWGCTATKVRCPRTAGGRQCRRGHRQSGLCHRWCGVRVLVKHNGGPGFVCMRMRIERSTFAANGGTAVDCRCAWFVNSVACPQQRLRRGRRRQVRAGELCQQAWRQDRRTADRLPGRRKR